jgi:hypothetical protein
MVKNAHEAAVSLCEKRRSDQKDAVKRKQGRMIVESILENKGSDLMFVVLCENSSMVREVYQRNVINRAATGLVIGFIILFFQQLRNHHGTMMGVQRGTIGMDGVSALYDNGQECRRYNLDK